MRIITFIVLLAVSGSTAFGQTAPAECAKSIRATEIAPYVAILRNSRPSWRPKSQDEESHEVACR